MSQRNIIDKCMSFCLDVNLESWVGFVYGLGHGWCWQMRSEDVLLFRKDGTVKFNFRSCRRCHSQAAAAARLIYSKGSIAFIHLRLLNLVLDALLLHSSVLWVTPPNRALILAFHTKVNAGTTGWMLLITLLSAEAAGKTARARSLVRLVVCLSRGPCGRAFAGGGLSGVCGGFVSRFNRRGLLPRCQRHFGE